MKKFILTAISLFTCMFASAAIASPVDVTIADNAGKVAYKGRTKDDGTFATSKLQPGKYVVQFNSTQVTRDHTIVVGAGKNKVTADLVAAKQFAGGGVAMRIDVPAGANITGQVVDSATARAAGSMAKRKAASTEQLRHLQENSAQGAMPDPLTGR